MTSSPLRGHAHYYSRVRVSDTGMLAQGPGPAALAARGAVDAQGALDLGHERDVGLLTAALIEGEG